jgi:hypothetical protein
MAIGSPCRTKGTEAERSRVEVGWVVPCGRPEGGALVLVAEGVTIRGVGVQVGGRILGVAVEVGRMMSTGIVAGGAGLRGDCGSLKIMKKAAHNPTMNIKRTIVRIFHNRLDLRRFSSSRISSGNSSMQRKPPLAGFGLGNLHLYDC